MVQTVEVQMELLLLGLAFFWLEVQMEQQLGFASF